MFYDMYGRYDIYPTHIYNTYHIYLPPTYHPYIGRAWGFTLHIYYTDRRDLPPTYRPHVGRYLAFNPPQQLRISWIAKKIAKLTNGGEALGGWGWRKGGEGEG
jgi:hypothetical protein